MTLNFIKIFKQKIIQESTEKEFLKIEIQKNVLILLGIENLGEAILYINIKIESSLTSKATIKYSNIDGDD